MLVVGMFNNYSNVGGIVVGNHNTTDGPFSSVSGGVYNRASSGGASVSGGIGNEASSNASSISGGAYGIAIGDFSSISGGAFNEAIGEIASVTGGAGNDAIGPLSTVSGGSGNYARGESSSVSGGHDREAPGDTTGEQATCSRTTSATVATHVTLRRPRPLPRQVYVHDDRSVIAADLPVLERPDVYVRDVPRARDEDVVDVEALLCLPLPVQRGRFVTVCDVGVKSVIGARQPEFAGKALVQPRERHALLSLVPAPMVVEVPSYHARTVSEEGCVRCQTPVYRPDIAGSWHRPDTEQPKRYRSSHAHREYRMVEIG